jgi:hypothetical protein
LSDLWALIPGNKKSDLFIVSAKNALVLFSVFIERFFYSRFLVETLFIRKDPKFNYGQEESTLRL